MGRIAGIVFGLCTLLGLSAQAATLTSLTSIRALECLNGTTGTLRVNPARVTFREDVTLSWSTTKPIGCEKVTVEYEVLPSSGREVVSASGSTLYRPIVGERLQLMASIGDYTRVVAVAQIAVDIPRELVIDANDQGPALVEALKTPDSMITVASGVSIDLTTFGMIEVASGVTLKGTRGKMDLGARLFTRQRTKEGLFRINFNDVRISGVRIEGPDMGPIDGEENEARGIFIQSATGVEISNNEIYGWTSAGIEVQDKANVAGIHAPYAVRIFDNYIHHNQHIGANGYGVATRHGGFAWIAQNVFDWNRHAIAAGSQAGSGYDAESNLVLENGGLHKQIASVWFHTHQFDAHGSERCLGELLVEHNCGPAGDSFYVFYNTFLYTHDSAIRLRGTPRVDNMFVDGNVFAHEWIGDAVTWTTIAPVIGPSNVRNNTVVIQEPTCDFDGDGFKDRVMTTGATWWYASGGVMQWRYLNTHTEKIGGDWVMGYVNGDQICDITARGVVYSGGKTALPQVSGSLPPSLPTLSLP